MIVIVKLCFVCSSITYCSNFRRACAIELADQVVITGGNFPSASQATVYGDGGWVADLPTLNTGRYDHACGHFVNTDNQEVGI